MGFLSDLRAKSAEPELTAAAGYMPYLPSYWSSLVVATSITRDQALTVPAVARARNILCGTIGAMPLTRWQIRDNRRIDALPLQYQPDPDMPKSVTMAWLVDSILFYGVGYVQVIEQYADTRVSRFRWIDPNRVQPLVDALGVNVTGYLLDGMDTPKTGIGRLIVFPGIDQGLLYRGSRTITTAIELEEAANRAAKEPLPQAHLANKGVPLPSAKITEVLEAWKEARRTRSTAFTNGDIDLKVIGFNPAEQQLVEARSFHAAEIARLVGIPSWYLNAETASMTYSNTEQERRSLIDFSLKPYLRLIEERLSMSDFLPGGLEFRFDLDSFLRGSSEEQMRVITGYVSSGIMDLPEARAAIDLSPRGAESAN
jgi:HK97 family phage portal protein